MSDPKLPTARTITPSLDSDGVADPTKRETLKSWGRYAMGGAIGGLIGGIAGRTFIDAPRESYPIPTPMDFAQLGGRTISEKGLEMVVSTIDIDLIKAGLIGTLNPEMTILVTQGGTPVASESFGSVHDIINIARTPVSPPDVNDMEAQIANSDGLEPSITASISITDSPEIARALEERGDYYVYVPFTLEPDAKVIVRVSQGDQTIWRDSAGNLLVRPGSNYSAGICYIPDIANTVHETQQKRDLSEAVG